MAHRTDCDAVQPFEVMKSTSFAAAVASEQVVLSIRSRLGQDQRGRIHPQEARPAHIVSQCLQCKGRELQELGSV